ncbi:nucleotide sugar dehydrogenase [Saccharopolyspora sp. HNM0983]|uniref:Nucleotide sugar dehydrogenase n=1 Tax=Saccharopolyspora montiporae TaxID=2781240 RepID=A0A929B8C4_9PSEU|nr:nucleotide sugar dehydrogenase [Saccharopolyspora sp. HNM0983]
MDAGSTADRDRFDLAVVGLGYVGLPLAVRAVDAGLRTVGVDTSDSVVDGLIRGRSHIGDVDDSAVSGMLGAGFTATTGTAVLSAASVIVLCVPTGLTGSGQPDLSAVHAAVRSTGERIRPGTLVCLESTSHPGTTEDVVRPILERCSGLRVGEDLHLAYSPERIDPGNPQFGVANTPKVVAGCTPLCTKHATAFYEQLADPIVAARGTREAETAKLLENSYRYVNIALVNELAMFCAGAGIDVWDVLSCAASKPFGFTPFQPGPGVGGHCIPVDPRYLEVSARQVGVPLRTLETAREVNERMPVHVADQAAALLRSRGREPAGSRVLLLGVTYKPGVADMRESPAFAVARSLLAAGAHVRYHDPLIDEFHVDGHPLSRVDEPFDTENDLLVLLQEHSCYDRERLASGDRLVLDTRGPGSTRLPEHGPGEQGRPDA